MLEQEARGERPSRAHCGAARRTPRGEWQSAQEEIQNCNGKITPDMRNASETN